MKVFQFIKDKKVMLGLISQAGYYNLTKIALKNKQLPSTMKQLIEGDFDEKKLLSLIDNQDLEMCSEMEYAPVVSDPEKIICVGLNYASHIKETNGITYTQFPPIFCKFRSSLLGHGKIIHQISGVKQYDYEAELVIVIGKQAKNITEQDAKDYIFGYTIGNDFSARDLQFQTSQWILGKACDGFAPVGPFVVTKEELNPDNLAIVCQVNGEVVQKSTTSQMMFGCNKIVSYLSRYMTLMPGDLIFTGTPEGVILGKEKEQQKWLKKGDKITVSIEGIGELTNELA